MSEIKVNIELLEKKIQKLRDLKIVCDSIAVAAEDISGSGQSINMLSFVDHEYSGIKESILTLLTNSIVFFENIKDSMVAADEEASAKVKSEA